MARNGSCAITRCEAFASAPVSSIADLTRVGSPSHGREMPSFAVFGALFLSTAARSIRVDVTRTNIDAWGGMTSSDTSFHSVPTSDGSPETYRRHVFKIFFTLQCHAAGLVRDQFGAALRHDNDKIRVSGLLGRLIGNRPTADERRLSWTGFNHLLAQLRFQCRRSSGAVRRCASRSRSSSSWRGASPPEQCADETRPADAKLENEIEIVDVQSYALGIARLVLLESRRRPATLSSADLTEIASLSAPVALEAERTASHLLDRCLAALPPTAGRWS